MKRYFGLFVLLLASLAFGQGVFVPPQIAFRVVNGYTSPIANATVTVCAANASGIPCSPVLVGSIFKDQALTQPLSNPFTADAQGNYQFAVLPGTYTVTVTAFGFAGYSYQITLGSGSGGVIATNLAAPQVVVAAGPTGITSYPGFTSDPTGYLMHNGFLSNGVGTFNTTVFPAVGFAPDLLCGYDVLTGFFQLCGLTDPNNGFTYLATNDGIGLPNENMFVMPFCTLGSFQPVNAFGVWNPTLGCLNWTLAATAQSYQTIDGSFGSSQTGAASACETSFGVTTLSTGGTTTNTGLNCLPANSVIDAVVYRITTTITTAATFTIGDGTTAGRFCGTQSTLTAGTTGICFVQADQTGAAGPRQSSAAKVRVTTNANPGAGAIRLIVYSHTWTAPTS